MIFSLRLYIFAGVFFYYKYYSRKVEKGQRRKSRKPI